VNILQSLQGRTSKIEARYIVIGIVVFGIISKFLNVHNWIYEAHFNLISYNPYVPFIGLAVGWGYLIILLGSKGHARNLIIPTIIGLVYDIILMYGVFQTPKYIPMIDQLKELLVVEILILAVFTWLVLKD